MLLEAGPSKLVTIRARKKDSAIRFFSVNFMLMTTIYLLHCKCEMLFSDDIFRCCFQMFLAE